MEPLKVIPTHGDGPFAVQYRHGWTVNGPLRIDANSTNEVLTCNRITVLDVESVKELPSSSSIMKSFEFDFSEQDKGSVPGQTSHSQEDIKFLQKAEDGIRMINGHYELPLPFRSADILVPNNKEQAIKRLSWQRRKMKSSQLLLNQQIVEIQQILFSTIIPHGIA